MTRIMLVFAVGLGLLPALPRGTVAAAQQRIMPPKRLAGEEKMRYLAHQLDLTDEQKAGFEEMILAVYRPIYEQGVRELQANAGRVRVLYEDLQKANAAGDRERAKAISTEISKFNPRTRADAEFYEAVKQQVLTKAQVSKLEAARERLTKDPTGALAPDDVLAAAGELKLSDEQKEQLGALKEKVLGPPASQPVMRVSPVKQVRELLEGVKGLLNEAQAREFDERIDRLRTDRDFSRPLTGPETAPAPPAKSGNSDRTPEPTSAPARD